MPSGGWLWWVPKCVQLCRLALRFPRSSFCEGSRCTNFGWVGTSPSISPGRLEKVAAPPNIYAYLPHQVAPSPPAKGSVPPKRPAASLIKATSRAENAAGTCGNKPRCPKIARWTCVPSAHAQFKRKLLLCCRPLAQRRPPPFVGSELDRY